MTLYSVGSSYFVREDDRTSVQEPRFHCFNELLPEMMHEIFARMDMSTQNSFSWTCKAYYRLFADPDFTNREFANKCAQLGYERLFTYSLAKEAHKSILPLWLALAAKHGHYFEQSFNIMHCRADQKRMIWSLAESGLIEQAQRLNRKLGDDANTPLMTPDLLVMNLLSGGHLNLALQLFEDCTPQQKTNFNSRLRSIWQGNGRGLSKELILFTVLQKMHSLTELNLQGLLHLTFSSGDIEFFKDVRGECRAKGKEFTSEEISIGSSHSYNMGRNYYSVLQYLTSEFNITLRLNEIPTCANKICLDWMKQRGLITFHQKMLEDFLPHGREIEDFLPHGRGNLEALQWFFDQGGQLTTKAVYSALKIGCIKLLDFLWIRKPPEMSIEPNMLKTLISNYKSVRYMEPVECADIRLKLRRSVRWLLNKGAVWGKNTKLYSTFVNKIGLSHAKTYIDEFHMPVSKQMAKIIQDHKLKT